MKTTKKLIVVGLLLALAGVTVSARPAQEAPPPPTPTPTETPAPETPAPETPVPETPTPETPAPETPAPATPAPGTPAPETPAPAPTTPAPTTPAPQAPGTPVTPAAKVTKPVEQQLNGRVVAVDNSAKTITIQVNSQTYVLKTIEATKFTKGGKTKSFDDLIVGEDVTVTVALQETPSGRIEIAVVAVDLPTSAEAKGSQNQGHSYGYGIPPFVNLPNPANVGGGVRSPN